MHTSNPIRCRIIPKKFLSPVSTLPPVRKVTPPVAKPSLVEPITISPPGPYTQVPTGSSDDSIAAAFWDYQSLFVSQRSETTDPIALRVVDGAVPPDFPSGTYFLAGPGIFSDDHGSSVHPLDGHGYVRAFEIDGGGGEVRFMAKYVKTEAHVEEHDKESGTWRFTHRGPFSVLKGGKRFGNTKVMKNVANTSAVKWGGRLLCLWEGGTPYEIESRSLDTVDRFDLVQDKNSDSDSDQSWGGDMWSLAAKVLKPILCGSMGAVGGLFPMISALSLNPSKTTSPIYLLPRFSDEKSRDWRVTVEAPSQMWLLHVGNAFQVKDVHGNSHIQIYASSCSYQWFNFQKLFATSSGSRQNLPHFPFDTVVKLNVVTKSSSTWSVGPRTFIGEPIFVSKGIEEDDGYLLVVEYAVSIQRCFLVILNPKRIGEDDALVARLEVPGNFNFPLGFHGFWATGN
ncbi:hypothetical protein LWI28_008960 [Acer negundo]|uniref:Carotenoid cleavage dioxygenase 7 n=1 Tax=Acer negundo TaxID=4023 RepID=A0AAD5NLG6_ACENE|nr:hypothetical protein LWI28_008960 [Acer negundo]